MRLTAAMMLSASLCASAADAPSPLAMPDGTTLGRSGSMMEVNGTRFYYEVHGEGEPVLLMHGAYATVESMMGQAPELSKSFKVILAERRGHGRTPDTAGPFSYEQGAADMAALLKALGVGKAHLVGWSDGGIVALTMGLRHPDSVKSIAAIGANTNPSGLGKEFLETFKKLDAAGFEKGEAQTVAVYKKVSPDGPDHFPVVFRKITKMILTQPDLKPADLKKIAAPTLVVAGDDDVVSLSHTTALFKSLPKAQLFIAPGTSHLLPLEKPALLNGVLRDFINSPPKEKSGKGLFNE